MIGERLIDHGELLSAYIRGKQVAIAAPGVDILVPAPAGGYQLTTGTSVAATISRRCSSTASRGTWLSGRACDHA